MAFPLAPPSGMRDLLPPEAAARADLAGRLKRVFDAWGYALVTTPPFEHAEVIERGLGAVDRRELLRLREAIYDFAFEPPIDGAITETRRGGPPPARLPSLETPLEGLDDEHG